MCSPGSLATSYRCSFGSTLSKSHDHTQAEVRTEARWRGNRWVIGTYRYLGAHCLGKLPSGKCLVYHMSFRRTKQADGSFGELALWSVGHAYEIAEKNINK